MYKYNFSTSSPTFGIFVFVFLCIVTIPNGSKMVSHSFDLLFPNSVLKSRDITLPTKVYIVKSDLPSGHVRLWEMDCKEGRAPKNWCLWTLVLEKTPENPLDSKEIRSVNLKGNKPWILVGRTDVEAEALIFWLSDANSWLTGKVSDTGKDWWLKEKRVSEDKMA